MAKIEIILPAMGEGIIEATLTKWLVREGDMVEEDDPVVEVATDKVDTEIPSPASGILSGFEFKEGDIPKVGEVLAYITSKGDEKVSDENKEKINSQYLDIKTASSVIIDKKIKSRKTGSELKSRTPAGKYLSPLVRKMVQEEGISYTDLDNLKGTGMDGRITRDDILKYISDHRRVTGDVIPETQNDTSGSEAEKNRNAPSELKISGFTSQGDEIIEMDRVRKLIAKHMVKSKQTSPHVTTFIDVDITDTVIWRNRIKDNFFKREGNKITLTPIFFEVTARTLRQFPMINVSVDGNNIIKKRNINIGMATALPNGNLIVPVIKNADEKSIIGLVREVNDLANRARQNRLKPEEIMGGTFTITNYGTVGNLMGTPIINQPESAILGIGAIRKVPAVIETPSGDTIGIRQVLYLSLSYDHRIIDGSLAGMFVAKLKENLENFTKNKFLDEFEI